MSRSYRKTPYYKSGRFDKTCRPGGSCPYCRENRLRSRLKQTEKARLQIKEYFEENELKHDLIFKPRGLGFSVSIQKEILRQQNNE